MQRYLSFWLALTGCLLLVVGVFNFFVDPYGLFRVVDQSGFNRIKPKAGAQGETMKAYQVLRVQPQGLILGNSRAEVGFDPMHPGWAARPVYNLALPGTGTRTSLQYLRHVLANGQDGRVNKPEVVVWGLDFMDFLIDSHAPLRPYQSANPRLLSQSGGYTGRVVQQMRDYADATLTLSALQDSILTLSSQTDPYSGDLTSLGFNPMRDYLKITADEGYWAVFRQKNLENTKALLRHPGGILDAGGHSSPALADLRAVIRLCRQNNMDLHLVIYPYHADLLEIIRITGHGSAFEAWKRALVIASETSVRGDKPIPLWDFSRFHEITGEAVPAKGDRQTKMRWYWEAGHFKSELGELVLNRVLNQPESLPGFGVRLNSGNVEEQIALDRVQENAYRLSHLQDVTALEQIADKINSTPFRH